MVNCKQNVVGLHTIVVEKNIDRINKINKIFVFLFVNPVHFWADFAAISGYHG
jgi:hypothetical protein